MGEYSAKRVGFVKCVVNNGNCKANIVADVISRSDVDLIIGFRDFAQFGYSISGVLKYAICFTLRTGSF